MLEHGEERGGLAASGGTAYDQKPLWKAKQALEACDEGRIVAQSVKRKQPVARRHEAEHDPFAVNGRKSGDANVAAETRGIGRNGAFLGNVRTVCEQAGQHLQPSHDIGNDAGSENLGHPSPDFGANQW